MQGKQVSVLDELDNYLIMIIKNIHQIDDSSIYKLETFEVTSNSLDSKIAHYEPETRSRA